MEEMLASVRATPSAPQDPPRVTAVPAGMAGAQRVPIGGAGPTMKQNSIFGDSSGGMSGNQIPMAGQRAAEPKPSPSLGDVGNGERSVVFAQPSLGQSAPAVPPTAPTTAPAPLEPYPQIDKVIQAQSVGVALSRIKVTAILEALGSTLTRIAAPENSGSVCVKNLGPAAVEKATTLRNKMTAYLASGVQTPFTDFTADELAGSDKILNCAAELAPPGASSTGLIMAVAVLGVAGAGIYYLMTKKK